MPKRKRASWDFDVIVPLKSVPEWLRGDDAAHAEHRPQLCMFDMLLVLGEVQRVTGYEVGWEYCHEGGITLNGEIERYREQNVKGGGYPYRPTLRFTSDALCEQGPLKRPVVCDFLTDMLCALNDRAEMVRVPTGDCGLWHGTGLDAPPLCGADTSAPAWDALLSTVKLFRPEDFMRVCMNRRCTLVEVENALRMPFPLGFKVGMDYAWSTESFGVLEAALKRRLRALRSFSNRSSSDSP